MAHDTELESLLENPRVSDATIARVRAFEAADEAFDDILAALDKVSRVYAGYSEGVKFRALRDKVEALLIDPISDGFLAVKKEAAQEADDEDDWRGDDLAREEAITGTVR